MSFPGSLVNKAGLAVLLTSQAMFLSSMSSELHLVLVGSSCIRCESLERSLHSWASQWAHRPIIRRLRGGPTAKNPYIWVTQSRGRTCLMNGRYLCHPSATHDDSMSGLVFGPL